MFLLWSVQNTLMWSLSTLFKLFRAFKNYSRTVIGKIFMLFPQMKLNIQAKLFCKWTWRVLRQWFSRSQPLDFLTYNTNRSMIEVCSKYCSLSNKTTSSTLFSQAIICQDSKWSTGWHINSKNGWLRAFDIL